VHASIVHALLSLQFASAEQLDALQSPAQQIPFAQAVFSATGVYLHEFVPELHVS
jgi:hypothetical protein